MHDLSIFVGRKHFDRVEEPCDSEEASKVALDALVEDPARICYGTLPQGLLDEYCMAVANVWEIKRESLEIMKKSIKNAMIKYNKTKDPASQNSISIMRALIDQRPMKVHPSLAYQVDEKEEALRDFKDMLSKFKPK